MPFCLISHFSLSYKTIRKAHVYKLFCYSVAELWVILMIMILILLHWPIKWDWAATPKFYNFIEETVFCTHCKYIHYTKYFSLQCAKLQIFTTWKQWGLSKSHAKTNSLCMGLTFLIHANTSKVFTIITWEWNKP